MSVPNSIAPVVPDHSRRGKHGRVWAAAARRPRLVAMPPAAIRRAGAPDAEAIARVHVAAWRETYRGIVPDAVLAALSVEQRAAGWRAALAAHRPDAAVFVAEERDAVVGFAAGGPRRGAEFGAVGEVYAIYVLRRAQRRGVGGSLLGALAAFLAGRGIGSLGLWVARDNLPARAFYAARGAAETGARVLVEPDFTLAEVACEWADVAALADPDAPAC
jgi:ribosomal protein S18 acetylase RimI-like enzyme